MPKYRFVGTRMGYDGQAFVNGQIVEMPEACAIPLGNKLARVGDAEKQSDAPRISPPAAKPAQAPKPTEPSEEPLSRPKAAAAQRRAAKKQRRAAR